MQSRVDPFRRRLHHGDDGQIELHGEGEVTFVTTRDGHDRAGAVAHQHVIRDPDRNLPAGDGIGGEGTGEDAGLVLGFGGAFQVGTIARGGDVGFDGGAMCRSCDAGDQRMFRGDDHVGCAEEGIGSGGIDANAVAGAIHEWEGHFRPGAASHPVTLHEFDGFGPVEIRKIGQKAFGVAGDAEHPLFEGAAVDHVPAAFAASIVVDFFVGEDGAQCGTPVDGHLVEECEALAVEDFALFGNAQRGPGAGVSARNGADDVQLGADAPASGLQFGEQFSNRACPADVLLAVRSDEAYFLVEPAFEHLQEHPLGEAVELRIGGGEFARPVVGKTKHAQLLAVAFDVGLRGDGRVYAGFDSILLCGEAKRIEPHGVQDVKPAHALVSGDNVGCAIAERVTYVESGPAGIGEHVENVELGLAGVAKRVTGVGAAKGLVLFPMALPLGFDGGEVVSSRFAFSDCLRHRSTHAVVRLQKALVFAVAECMAEGAVPQTTVTEWR